MKWSTKELFEATGVLAVVLSLLLVAYEVRQANRIAVVNAEFELRNSFHATNIALLSNPGMVDFVVLMQTRGQSLEGADGVRARAWTYLSLNSWLATALAYESGIATEETYRNVLDNIDNAIARSSPEMRAIWRASIESFPSLQDNPVFQEALATLGRYESADPVQSIP